MSFERRVTLSAALAVAVAVLLVALASYVIVRQEFHHTVSKSLKSSLIADQEILAGRIRQLPTSKLSEPQRLAHLLGPHVNRIGVPGIVELVSRRGKVTPAYGITRSLEIASSRSIRRLAATPGSSTMFEERLGQTNYEVLAGWLGPGLAIVIDRSLSEQDATLSHLRLVLFVAALIGIALAALLGWFVARTTLAPVRRLTAAAEHVTATNDLVARIDETRRDELGSLRGASTRCSRRSTGRCTRSTSRLASSAGSSRTPRTSCAPRSPAYGPISSFFSSRRTSSAGSVTG